MGTSAQVYYARNFPRFHRLTERLSRLADWGRPVIWGEWGTILPHPISSPDALRRQVGGAGVVALSPSVMMMPALFRPLDKDPVWLTAEDWARIEPGRYMLACADGTRDSPPRWVAFERAPTSAE